jgi:uncharacterized protein YfaS (alpha-2-macroglobulin family)
LIDQNQQSIVVNKAGKYIVTFDDGSKCNTSHPIVFTVGGNNNDFKDKVTVTFDKEFYCVGDEMVITLVFEEEPVEIEYDILLSDDNYNYRTITIIRMPDGTGGYYTRT